MYKGFRQPTWLWITFTRIKHRPNDVLRIPWVGIISLLLYQVCGSIDRHCAHSVNVICDINNLKANSFITRKLWKGISPAAALVQNKKSTVCKCVFWIHDTALSLDYIINSAYKTNYTDRVTMEHIKQDHSGRIYIAV